MDIIVYVVRCLLMFLVMWIAIRILGKRSISQMTGYELAGLLMMTAIAAGPLITQVALKASFGMIAITLLILLIGRLTLNKMFYNLDSRPNVLIAHGEIDRRLLRKNRMNLPFLLSLLREKGYSAVHEIEYAILEPTGTLSVFPISSKQPVTVSDLKLPESQGVLSLPLIIDAEIQYGNLKYMSLTTDWLEEQLQAAGGKRIQDVFLAELQPGGKLHIESYNKPGENKKQSQFLGP